MKEKKYIQEKRIELVWALSVQDYSQADIARIFNTTPVIVSRMVKRKPEDWQPKWKKVI